MSSKAMTATSIRENLNPSDFVAEVLDQTLQFFLAFYGETLFLLVRLDGPTEDLLAGLAGLMATAAGPDGANASSLDGLSFQTYTGIQGHSLTSKRGSTTSRMDFDFGLLLERVRATPHVIVPLRKREQENAYMNRISIGRARNKDVVLRHSTVSKFHAWFEMDETGALYVADAGSKNGTTAKGQPMSPRTLVRVAPGDEIVFGSINATYCPAEALWELIHED